MKLGFSFAPHLADCPLLQILNPSSVLPCSSNVPWFEIVLAAQDRTNPSLYLKIPQLQQCTENPSFSDDKRPKSGNTRSNTMII